MVDWLDVGFDIVIGVAILCVICYLGLQMKKMMEKQMKGKEKEYEDELPRI